jgi:putative membrane protein
MTDSVRKEVAPKDEIAPKEEIAPKDGAVPKEEVVPAAVVRGAESIRRSAQVMRRSAGAQEDSADRRTQLAADRTVLAAERTYAAWVRTGLAALASGVGAKALLESLLPPWFANITGTVLVAFAGFCFVAGVWRELKPGAPPPKPDTRNLPNWVLIGLNGFLVVVSAATLVALWVARR